MPRRVVSLLPAALASLALAPAASAGIQADAQPPQASDPDVVAAATVPGFPDSAEVCFDAEVMAPPTATPGPGAGWTGPELGRFRLRGYASAATLAPVFAKVEVSAPRGVRLQSAAGSGVNEGTLAEPDREAVVDLPPRRNTRGSGALTGSVLGPVPGAS